MASIADSRVLVTGGAGFIGSAMCGRLAVACQKVVAYDNLCTGSYSFIEGLVSSGRIEFVKADLHDSEKLESELRRNEISAIVHLAASADVAKGTADTRLDIDQGTLLTYNVLEAARKCDVRDLLFSSSSTVYGIAEKKPTREDYGPLKPISLYGASKLASEGMITSFSHLFGIGYSIYRFANVTGRNSEHGVIPDFARKLRANPSELPVLGDGRQRKSYVEVDDCVDAMLFGYAKSGSRENIYNIAADDQITVAEIARIAIETFAPGARISYSGGEQGWPGDVPDFLLDNSRLKALGFVPKFRTSGEAVKNAFALLRQGPR
jgi:UDP-glucose 4-epimerase